MDDSREDDVEINALFYAHAFSTPPPVKHQISLDVRFRNVGEN